MTQGPGQGGSEAERDESEDEVREADEIVSAAMSSRSTRPKRVASSDELRLYDPIASTQSDSGSSDNGVNIISSFVNRTVFFDYFRHVAHKRFPELPSAERVQRLVDVEPGFYRRSILSDYGLKVLTTSAVILVALALVAKALFW